MLCVCLFVQDMTLSEIWTWTVIIKLTINVLTIKSPVAPMNSAQELFRYHRAHLWTLFLQNYHKNGVTSRNYRKSCFIRNLRQFSRNTKLKFVRKFRKITKTKLFAATLDLHRVIAIKMALHTSRIILFKPEQTLFRLLKMVEKSQGSLKKN